MKVKGVLLKFDVPNVNHSVISKDCKIDIPDKVPIVNEFNMWNYPMRQCRSIGFANVSRTNEGLIFEGDVISPYSEIISERIKNNKTAGAGGYYNKVKKDEKGLITEMTLRAVCYVNAPVNPDYKFEIVEESEEK